MKRILPAIVIFLFISMHLMAQEGMWMLTQIEQLGLEKKGLQLSAKEIYNPEKTSLFNAIVQIGGGTGSFVSSNGLLVTNHHVAFTALQRAASAEKDYLKNGFLAQSFSEEIPAPGYTARLLVEMKDITEMLNDFSKDGKTPLEQQELKQKKIRELRESNSKGEDDTEVVVSEMYNGKMYFLFKYRLFKDVRIVYAPPMSVGNYGGETDNWMWPRHTGDFTFLRVYSSKEGKGTPYAQDNIPYKPKVWLKIAKDDLNEGDFTFIMGYPGFTTRYRSSTSVDWNLNKNYPVSITNFKAVIEIGEKLTENDREGRIKISDLTKSLANAMKNYEGKVEAMKRTNFLQKKIDFEKEFMTWVTANKTRNEKYGTILSREKDQYALIAKYWERDNFIGNLQSLAGKPMEIGFYIYYVAKERTLPGAEQRPDLSDEAMQDYLNELKYSLPNYYEPVDKALFIRMMKQYSSLPENQKIPELTAFLAGKDVETLADAWFKKTPLTSADAIKSLLKQSYDEIKQIDDPFLKIAAAIYSVVSEANTTNRLFGANVSKIRQEYMSALFEWKGTSMYPDANSSMRFTSGYVKGYNPRDAVVYAPFTTLNGVIEKNTGVEPFDAPRELLEIYNKKDFGKWVDPSLQSVPVAFTHTCDITGGNSGSPVMNGKGELIGLAFDGNYEALISDWQYDPALQRTISVDIRYVLFITEKLAGSQYLLQEMGVK